MLGLIQVLDYFEESLDPEDAKETLVLAKEYYSKGRITTSTYIYIVKHVEECLHKGSQS